MDTNREDFSIVIRSAFLKRETKQRFSLFLLVLVAVVLILIERIETKPLNYFRSIIKDTIYRGSFLASMPSEGINKAMSSISKHIKLYNEYDKLKAENSLLKNN